MAPLEGIRVLDFSTLLPGPLASLILAEAGAEVIKVERPGTGDGMRGHPPLLDGTGGGFALMNRGKRSVALDLQAPGAAAKLLALAPTIDIVLEQFRPGVMARLGLGYEAFRERNARIVYCSITGYGQDGPLASVPGHDINYQAQTGMLSVTAGKDGAPGIPAALVADIGGGTYPAVVNILLALRERDRSGAGCYIDVAMAENLFTFLFWGLALGQRGGAWPTPGGERLTGGFARYRIYRTSDGRYLAVGALEDKFWEMFCEIAQVPAEHRDDARDPAATIAAVERIVAARSSAEWSAAFEGKDACVCLVRSLEEAVRDLHFKARGVFERRTTIPGHVLPALPVPVVAALRRQSQTAAAPALGEHTQSLLEK